MYSHVLIFSYLLLFQNGLTAVHIACKNGRRAILSSLLEKAKTQKHFCFKRSLPSDYDVVMSAKAREVCVWGLYIHCIYPYNCKCYICMCMFDELFRKLKYAYIITLCACTRMYSDQFLCLLLSSAQKLPVLGDLGIWVTHKPADPLELAKNWL